MDIRYKIYNPSGNITALVIGDNYTKEQRKIINDEIMSVDKAVEQVGFVSQKNKKLTMAGGEFCGNATRCAARFYMENIKDIEIEINNQKLKAGIDEKDNVWCEIPIEKYRIIKLDDDIYEVILKGITFLVTEFKQIYQNSLKEYAQEIINKYQVSDEAVGVIFVERQKDNLKINPVVWVKAIDTLFLENACGSGTIATTMLFSFLNQKSNHYNVIQPSGDFLKTNITLENGKITKAILKGKIRTDNKIRVLNIKEEAL